MKRYSSLPLPLLFSLCWIAMILLPNAAETAVDSSDSLQFAGPQEPPFVPRHPIAIVGGLLIDATGAPPKVDYGVVIDGERIVQVDRTEALEIPPDAQIIDAAGMTIMPGIINSNQHLQLNPLHVAGDSDMPLDVLRARWADHVARMPQKAFIYLMQGITSQRQTSGPTKHMLAIKQQIDKGEIAGPRIFLGGATFASGRRFEARHRRANTPADRVAFLRNERNSAIISDIDKDTDAFLGPEYSFWKISLTDEIFDGENDFTDEELRFIIDKAHKHGKKVDMHTGRHNAGLRRGTQFDIDTLQHPFNGQELVDEDIIKEYVRKGVIVDTLLTVRVALAERQADPHRFNETLYAASMSPAEYRTLLRYRDKLLYQKRNPDETGIYIYEHHPTAKEPEGPPGPAKYAESFGETGPSYNQTQERRETSRENMRRFIREGAIFSLGTDTPTFMNFLQEDPNADEFRYMIEMGMAPMDAIQAATYNGAKMLGMEDQLGTLEEGKLADVIIVAGNPLLDASALNRVYAVIQGGVRYK
jgi:imidazolonepropionase-like amidohydrolase